MVKHRRNFGGKAPITEALIDIRVENPPELALQELKGFASPFAERFPEHQLQTHLKSEFRLDGPSLSAHHGVRGFSFFSPDKDRVVQARRDGFTLSKLPPYESWECLRDEARELWSRYRDVARQCSVKRLAVRYINRIPLPSSRVQLNEWFNLHPETPDALGDIDDYLVRVMMRHPDNDAYHAIVTQATLRQGQGTSVVLDIDVFMNLNTVISENGVWEVLDDLRDFKNDVFFGILTPKAEESLL